MNVLLVEDEKKGLGSFLSKQESVNITISHFLLKRGSSSLENIRYEQQIQQVWEVF